MQQLDVQCIYLGDCDPHGVDIYLQYVANQSLLGLLEQDKRQKSFLCHYGPFFVDYQQVLTVTLNKTTERSKLYSLLSTDYLRLPPFKQVLKNLENMAATGSKFEVEAVLCEEIDLINR